MKFISILNSFLESIFSPIILFINFLPSLLQYNISIFFDTIKIGEKLFSNKLLNIKKLLLKESYKIHKYFINFLIE